MLINQSLINNALSLYFTRLNVQSWDRLSGGIDNISLLVKLDLGQVVLRFWGKKHAYMGIRRDSDIFYELALMDLFYKHHLPVPKIYRSLNNRTFEKVLINNEKRPFAVIDYIEGVSPKRFNKQMAK